MSTYGTMQDRIANELSRTDLTTRIQEAIQSAVAHYQKEPWYFCEDRSKTFSTVAGQEFYTSSDLADIPNYQSIEYLEVTVNSTNRFRVEKRDGELIAGWSTNTGFRSRPTDFAYFAKQIRLYPIPDAVYTIRIVGQLRQATLSSTADSNAWMTDAERLVRSRAKADIYENVIRTQPDMTMRMKTQEADAYSQLRSENAARVASSRVTPTRF